MDDSRSIGVKDVEKKRTLKDSLDRFYQVNEESKEIAELTRQLFQKFFNPHGDPIPDNPGNASEKGNTRNIVEVFNNASEMIHDNHNVIRENLIEILEMMD